MVGIFTGLGAGFERGSGASLGGVGLLGGAGLGRNNEGVFVNAATGNLLVAQRDEFLIGRGPDAEIARTYNSFGALNENGDHWRQSTDRRVFGLTGTVNTAGSTIKRVSADGSEITYSWTGSHYQTTDGGGAHDRLTYADNIWTWRDGDSQWTETYSAHGAGTWRITGQSDTSGNTLSFTYTGDQLTRVTTADGGYIQYSWSGSNITLMVTGYTNLATSTSQTLTRTRYGYDGQGRLSTVTVDLTPENNSVSDGQAYTTTYTYHGTSNRIATISQTDGSSLAIGYDGSGRVTSLTQTVASGDTRVTGFTYLAGETRVTDPRGQVTRLFYDAAGQLTGVTAPVPQTGGTASTVAFSYDAAGNLASMTDASGAVTQYRYDAQGNVTYVRHPNGSTTLRVYDLANKLVQEIRTGAAITLPAGVGNQAPQAATNAITVTQQQGGGLSLDVAALFSDPGDTLTYTVSGLPSGLSFSGQMITGTASATGTYTITATASDGSLSATRTFTLAITAPANQAPVAATSVDAITQEAGGSITLDLSDLFDDPENDSLTFSATGIPAGMSRSGSILSGAPTTEGTYTVTVSANDGQYTTQRTITITVTAPGGVIAPVSWTLADYFDTPSSGTVTYGASGYPSGLSVSGGVLSGTPAAPGTWPVTVTASRPVTMTVSAVPSGPPAPPTVPSGLPVTNGTSGDDYIVAGSGNGYYNGGSGWNTLEVSGSMSDYYFYVHSATEGLIVHKTTGQIIVGTNFGAVYFDGSDDWAPVNYLFGVREGTSAAEYIVGTDANELIEAGDGNDEIYSGLGNDHIDGGAGWDRINLYGEKADYTFLRHPDGKLSIIHNPTGKHDVAWNIEQFAFLSGPWSDQISDLTITDVTYAAPALVPNSGTINPVSWTIADFFDTPSDPSIVYTATGLPSGLSVSGGVISGTPAAAGTYTFNVTATRVVSLVAAYAPPAPALPAIPSGTPLVNGTSGYDYFVDTAGNQIYDGLGDWNMIEMGGVVADYDFFLDPVSYDAMMVHKTTGELTVLRNINGVSFSGNWAFFDNYYLFGVPDGTPGDDTIVGSALNEHIEGGSGIDYIYAGGGNNYIDGGAGDWDRVNFIGEKDDYTFLRHPDGKISAIHGPSGQHDVIWNVEFFAFRGGPWGDTIADLGVTDVAYAAPAFVPAGGPAAPVTGFSNIVFGGGGGGTPGTVSFNTGAMTFPAPVAGGVTVSAAHITAGLGDSTAVHARHVYDSAGRLRYSVSRAGNVTEYRYTAAGQLEYQIAYPGHVYSASTGVPTLTQMDTWRNGLADRSTTQIIENRYDARGNLTNVIRWGGATAAGGASNANGYRHDYLTYDQAGNLLSRRTAPDTVAETYLYDGLGRMTGSTDLHGGTTSIVFNDAATTTVITSGTGHVVTSVYNKAGDLISQTDSGSDAASAAQVSYLYDANGQVRRTAVRTGRTSDGDRTDYTYHLYDRSGRKIADIGHDGRVTEYRYDAGGRVVATARYNNRLTAAQITSLADPDSELELAPIRPASHGYDIWQWTTYTASGEVATTVLGDGSVTRYTYDQAGRLIATYGYRNKIAVSGYMNGTSLGPSAATLPTAHAGDTVTRTFYDVDGRVRGVLNAEGHLSRIVYDSAGQKVEETVYAGATTAGLRASGTYQQLWDSVTKNAARDITTRYVYDGQGLLRFTIDALGRVTENIYTVTNPWGASGVVRAVVQFAGTLGPLASYDFATVNTAVDALRPNTDNRGLFNVYNDRGQVAYTIDSAGAVTGFTYDAGGRVTKTVEYAALRATASVPAVTTIDSWAASNAANARVTRTYYSASGEVLATVDAEGYVTRNWYDAQGRIWDSRRYATAVSATDAWTISNIDSANKGAEAQTRYRYDQYGNLVDVYAPDGTRSHYSRYSTGQQAWEIQAFGQGTDEARVLIIYDQAGRVREKRYFTADTYVDTNSAHIRETYTYDGLGNLATVTGPPTETDPAGVVTAYTYDRLGRVLTETRASGTAEAVTTAFEYDAFGQVVRTIDARGHSSYSYYDQAGRTVRTVDAENYLTVTEYTAFGEVQSVTRRYNKVSGTPVVGTLPALPASHTLDATTSFTYDRLGRVLQATDATQTNYEAYTYNAFGNVLTHRNKLGGITSYQYDALGRRTQETLPAAAYNTSGTVAASAIVNRFEYDSRGNMTRKIEAYGISGQTRTTNYTYDAADRLRYVSGDAVQILPGQEESNNDLYTVTPTEEMRYDRRGNVIERIDANGFRTQTWYDKLDRVTHQLVQQTGTHGTLTRNTYDASGNVTETRAFETLVTMQANAAGTPPAGSGNARAVTFEYDRLNRMIWSRTQAVWTADFTSGATIMQSVLATHYLYDAMGNVIRVTDPNGGQVHSYYDKLGRKEREVDQGRYLTHWEYNAQGNVTRERRYAQPVTGTVSTTSYGTFTNNYPLSTPAEALAQTYQDRVTDYTYDRMGRKLTETRQGVLVFNGSNGFAVQNAVVSFTYNALGQVATKTEAADAGGAATNAYTYDAIGRLTSEARKAFTDFNGTSVTPTIDYYYNGAGDLVRQREQGATGSAERVTYYTYGAGGRLHSVTDAENFTRTYRYDRAGQIIREEYARQTPTGSVNEAVLYYYDAQGRVTNQMVTTADAGGNGYYTYDLSTQTTYNAFGEVASRGVNGVYAEQFRYDNAGRLTASSAGDGIWKYFLYDRNGNQTLAITSTGMNIQNQTVEWALGRWGTNWGAVATAHVAGVTATLTVYDARGLATSVREPQRDLATWNTGVTLTTSRSYNAFGDIVSETNARGHTVDYRHNTMGRLIRTENPQVNVTGENGVTSAQRPTEYYYYDRSGRMVASRDANGNLTRQTLLDGTGFGGSEALVTQVIHADGGVVNTRYDIHGNVRRVTDQLNRQTNQVFDRMGRMTQLTHAGGLVETFAYDGLGQQIRRYNSHYGSGVAETTLYDRQGRIQTHIAMGGDTTTYAYTWLGSQATTGAGTFGAWQTVTTMANLRSSTVREDQFGRTVYKSDLGGNVSSFTFNAGGQQVTQAITSATHGNQSLSYTYFNTGKLATHVKGTLTNRYAYDQAGNLIGESLQSGAAVLSNQTSTYDALGRMLTWNEAGSGTLPAGSITWTYDANGNIRSSVNTTSYLSSTGGSLGQLTNTYWYRFDTMNRVVTDKGVLTSGQIVRGIQGTDIEYDLAGQRWRSLTSFNSQVENPNWWNIPGEPPPPPAVPRYIQYTNTTVEEYEYNASGQIVEVSSDTGSHNGYTYSAPVAGTTRRARFEYDAVGRQTRQTDYAENGTTSQFDQHTAYNSKGQITLQDSFYRRSDGVYLVRNWHYYGQDRYYDPFDPQKYALGAVTHLLTQNFNRDANVTPLDSNIPLNSISTASATTTSYLWFDGASQGHVEYRQSINTSGQSIGGTVARNTYHSYDGSGTLLSASIADGRPRTVTYTSTASGQTIRRSEADNQPSNGDPHEVWYRFGGKELGYTGNNGTLETSYAASISNRMAVSSGSGAFRNGASAGTSHVAFDPSLDKVNSYNQGSTSRGYTARAGETLGSVAANLWGDSSLWYKLAQANGLSGDAALSEGQSLRIPAGVMKNTHNASTFKPYDPAETLGDTAPTAAKPPKKNKCGAFGQVLLVVIAVAVSLATVNPFTGGGILSGMASAGGVSAFAAGSIAGAAGSIASQAVGVATGIQEKFSWTGVAQAALGGGIGTQNLGIPGSGFGASLARGALGNVLSQAASTALGPQKKFSWSGVAAAGIGAGVGNWMGDQLKLEDIAKAAGRASAAYVAASTTAATASAIASAATRTAFGDGNFGDNIRRSIPDVIGQALGNVIGDKVSGWGNQQPDYGAIATQRANGLSWTGIGQASLNVSFALGPSFGGSISISDPVFERTEGQPFVPLGKTAVNNQVVNNLEAFLNRDVYTWMPRVTVTAPRGGTSLRYINSNYHQLDTLGQQERQARAQYNDHWGGQTAQWRANQQASQAFNATASYLSGGQVGVLNDIGQGFAYFAKNVMPRAGVNFVASSLEAMATVGYYLNPLGGMRAAHGALNGEFHSFSGALPRVAYRPGDEALGAGAEVGFEVASFLFGVGQVNAVSRVSAGSRVGSVADINSALPDAFAGVKQASAYLRAAGVDRATRVQILQSFERGTISVETAGDSLYGLRFHDSGERAHPMGQFLFETFTPQTNRGGLALPHEWNGMTDISQWQIAPGTTVLRGRTAPQLSYGSQYPGGAEQMFILEPWKYGSLK